MSAMLQRLVRWLQEMLPSLREPRPSASVIVPEAPNVDGCAAVATRGLRVGDHPDPQRGRSELLGRASASGTADFF